MNQNRGIFGTRRDVKSFDKICQKCEERKHVSKFKHRGSIYKICNTCACRDKKVCNYCKSEKHISKFYRKSNIFGICNECESVVEVRKNEVINMGFNLMDKISRGQNVRTYAN